MSKLIKNISIFASGSGSNATKIIAHFSKHSHIKVSLVVTNNPQARVIQLAEKEGLPVYITSKEEFFSPNSILSVLNYYHIKFIVLAGFLWRIPEPLIKSFPNSIVNIHPALLPKFGGKGMYGMHVHEAVIKAGEKESGISIHYVNEELDKGDIIFQAKCTINTTETPESLSEKVRELEHRHYARIIENLLLI